MTDDVAGVRALALLLPPLGLSGLGAALFVEPRRLRRAVGIVVVLIVAAGWATVLIAVALS